jgi:hypothetical protein
MNAQDRMADPGTTARSGAMAQRSDGTRPAAATGPPGTRGADDGVRRHCHGAMAYLKDLADELDSRGLVARVIRTGSGVAFVRVVNPLATTMRENVTCAPSPAGLHDWYYWWSWGECMHRVDDPAGAASKVAHVLDTAGAPAG